MSYITINIPTINDTPDDFLFLFQLYTDINTNNDDIEFNFSNCKFLKPNAVAFLGGLSRLLISKQRSVIFDWESFSNERVLKNLQQNGFAETFGYINPRNNSTSIPYREDIALDMNKIMDYITNAWIGKNWVHVSNKLRDSIAGRMWEIYTNAFEHSKTQIGVFTCGQYFFRNKDLILSVIDFGSGIPHNVRAFLLEQTDDYRISNISGENCLKWAIQRGNTTGSGGVARGLGLDLLKEFVALNKGKLEIYSNDGYVLINHKGENYQKINHNFNGTIIHITLQCDEKNYCFIDELENKGVENVD